MIALLPLFPVPYAPGVVGSAPGGYVSAIESLHLSDNATVLVVPVPNGGVTWPMRWYADKGLPAHMIGGDFIDASAKGRTSRSGRAGETPFTKYLDALWDKADDAGPGPSTAAIQAQMAAWKPAGIVAYSSPTSPLGSYLLKIFGKPTAQYGNVMAWKTNSSWM